MDTWEPENAFQTSMHYLLQALSPETVAQVALDLDKGDDREMVVDFVAAAKDVVLVTWDWDECRAFAQAMHRGTGPMIDISHSELFELWRTINRAHRSPVYWRGEK